MTDPQTQTAMTLDPLHFLFWVPEEGAVVKAGADQYDVPLPGVPLPVAPASLADGRPSDVAIGQGCYDYLRQFPDCPHNTTYAELLRDAYPHYLSDLAAHAVMLDAKDVEPAYILRKLTCLKILVLLDAVNTGLLLQLCRGFFDLALEFSEFHRSRKHLLDAMRYGHALLKADPDQPAALNLLAEIDVLFGDYPGAVAKWQRLQALLTDEALRDRIGERMQDYLGAAEPEITLVDDLEAIAEAVNLYHQKDFEQAGFLLERVEEEGRFTAHLPSADFYCLMGLCRRANGDSAGSFEAFSSALEIDPEHEEAAAALEDFYAQGGGS